MQACRDRRRPCCVQGGAYSRGRALECLHRPSSLRLPAGKRGRIAGPPAKVRSDARHDRRLLRLRRSSWLLAADIARTRACPVDGRFARAVEDLGTGLVDRRSGGGEIEIRAPRSTPVFLVDGGRAEDGRAARPSDPRHQIQSRVRRRALLAVRRDGRGWTGWTHSGRRSHPGRAAANRRRHLQERGRDAAGHAGSRHNPGNSKSSHIARSAIGRAKRGLH